MSEINTCCTKLHSSLFSYYSKARGGREYSYRADYLGSLSFIVYYKLYIKPTSENSVRIFVSLSARENANFQVGKLLKGR